MTIAEFARFSKIPYATLMRWHAQDTLKIRGDSLGRLVEALGMTVQQFDAAKVASHEPTLVDNNVTKADIRRIAPKAKMRSVQILNLISAGPMVDERMRDAERMGWVEAPVGDAPCFALWVDGDSMEPRYRNGDLVIFEAVDPECQAIIDGADYAIQLDGDHFYEQTFKRLYNQPAKGQWSLIAKPINPNTKPRQIEISRHHLSRLGMVKMVFPHLG